MLIEAKIQVDKMGLQIKKITVPFFILFFVSLSAFLVVKTIQLKNANTGFQEDIEEMVRKESALKQKYSEEKAKANTMQRAKLSADSRTRTLESEIETLKKSLEKAQNSQDTVVSELKKDVEALKVSLTRVKEERDTLKTRYDDISEEIKVAGEMIKKKSGELSERDDVIKELQSRLAETLRKIDRAVDHNRKLSVMAEELLAEFDDRNVFTSLMDKEPFTQQKRVRLERMIQEYLDRIDSDLISDPDAF